ncbi:MAG: methylated-DNA--[protein]-cysteine S-methyltransferase [Lachnospiraceae bacterium]
MYYVTTYESPIGELTLACDGQYLTGVWLAGQKYYGSTLEADSVKKENAILIAAKDWLDRYFAKEQPAISELPLKPAGGAFRQQVWELLQEIPYGEVVTYGSIAKKMAQKMGRDSMSSQAVGGAVGHNPIAIIIPCHRVVGSSGSLTGYAGGLDAKVSLLTLEGVSLDGLYRPEDKSKRIG